MSEHEPNARYHHRCAAQRRKAETRRLWRPRCRMLSRHLIRRRTNPKDHYRSQKKIAGDLRLPGGGGKEKRRNNPKHSGRKSYSLPRSARIARDSRITAAKPRLSAIASVE